MADGHLLSTDRNTPRLDVQAWFNRIDEPDPSLRPYRRGDSWTRHGFTFREDLNTTPGPCAASIDAVLSNGAGNTHNWNPSSAWCVRSRLGPDADAAARPTTQRHLCANVRRGRLASC